MVATDAGVAQLNSRKARQATHTQHIFFFFIDSMVAPENVSLQRTWIGGDVICAGEATAKAPVLSALVPQAVRCTTLSVPSGYNSGTYNFQPNGGKGPSVRDRYSGYMGLDPYYCH